MEKQLTCAERVEKQLEGRLEDLHKLWDLYCEDSEEYDDDLGNMYEYGLAFDYVAPNTFTDQKEGFFRYQLSTGGPGDEFRFFVNPDLSVHTIEYWFLNWWDGAHVDLQGSDFRFMDEIYESFFRDSGTAEVEYNKAMEDYEPEYEESDEEKEERAAEIWDDMPLDERVELCQKQGICVFSARHDFDNLNFSSQDLIDELASR